jgi:hypothetical protein
MPHHLLIILIQNRCAVRRRRSFCYVLFFLPLTVYTRSGFARLLYLRRLCCAQAQIVLFYLPV